MTLRTFTIPPEIARQFLATDAPVENLAIGAWEDVALILQEVTHTLVGQIENPTDPADKLYMTLELITIATEGVEIIATLYRRHHHPGQPFHHATNQDLTRTFAAIANERPTTDTLAFLRIPPITTDDETTQAAFDAVMTQAHQILTDLANYWTNHIAQVRWFRHLPASLNAHEPQLIDVNNAHTIKNQVQAFATERNDIIEIIVHPDTRVFSYERITLTDARIAAGITSVTLQLLFAFISNQVLLPTAADPAHRLPHLPPALTRQLTPEQRQALLDHGGYFLVP
jgi:hypothetical protein